MLWSIFIPRAVVKSRWDFTTKYYSNRTLLALLAGSVPASNCKTNGMVWGWHNFLCAVWILSIRYGRRFIHDCKKGKCTKKTEQKSVFLALASHLRCHEWFAHSLLCLPSAIVAVAASLLQQFVGSSACEVLPASTGRTRDRKYFMAPVKIVLNSRDPNISWAFNFVENTLWVKYQF